MAENQELVKYQGDKKPEHENPIIAFFINLFASIKLPFPIPQKKTDNSKNDSTVTKTNPPVVTPLVEDEVSVVSFPKRDENFADLKLQTQSEAAEQTTNPLLLWQVYAIGGFFILKWGWSRWNERKGQKKSGDEPPPSDD